MALWSSPVAYRHFSIWQTGTGSVQSPKLGQTQGQTQGQTHRSAPTNFRVFWGCRGEPMCSPSLRRYARYPKGCIFVVMA